MSELRPTITVSELARRAKSYADNLIADLEEVNRQYPHAIGITEEERAIADAKRENDGWPTLDETREILEQLLREVITRRYDIIEG